MLRPTIVLCFVLTVLMSACSSNSPALPMITEATLKPGDPIPTPKGPVILSLTGKIGVTNVDDRLDFDIEMLEQIGMVEYQVDDREYNRTVTLRGPLLKDVLSLAQIKPDSQQLFAEALNKYTIIIPLEVLKWPVMIATWRDGDRLPFEEKGPIQIAFPNKLYDIDALKYERMWVWHLRTITVE